jgi:hypothetical protein
MAFARKDKPAGNAALSEMQTHRAVMAAGRIEGNVTDPAAPGTYTAPSDMHAWAMVICIDWGNRKR